MNNQIPDLDQNNSPLPIEKPPMEEMNEFEKRLYRYGTLEVSEEYMQVLERELKNAIGDRARKLAQKKINWYKNAIGNAPASWSDWSRINIAFNEAVGRGMQLHDNLINMAITHPYRNVVAFVANRQRLNPDQKRYIGSLVREEPVHGMGLGVVRIVRDSELNLADIEKIKRTQQGFVDVAGVFIDELTREGKNLEN